VSHRQVQIIYLRLRPRQIPDDSEGCYQQPLAINLCAALIIVSATQKRRTKNRGQKISLIFLSPIFLSDGRDDDQGRHLEQVERLWAGRNSIWENWSLITVSVRGESHGGDYFIEDVPEVDVNVIEVIASVNLGDRRNGIYLSAFDPAAHDEH
jgi:hypothetical protein